MSSRPKIDPTEYARARQEKILAAKAKREAIAAKRREASGEPSDPLPAASPARTAPTTDVSDVNSPFAPRDRREKPRAVSNPEQWKSGPINPDGFEFNPASFEKKRVQSGDSCDADRPTTAIAVNVGGTECCVGSSDHAAYTFNVSNANPLRRLYGRSSGHSEWVSAVGYLGDGRVVTGGMDGKVCVWRRGGSECVDVDTEQGSIGNLVRLPGEAAAACTGYDGSVCVLDCKGARATYDKIANERKQLPPLMAFAVGDDMKAMTGANNGLISLWDLNAVKCTKAAVGKHGAVVQHIATLSAGCYATASVDGKVGFWDTRQQLGSSTGNEIGATMSHTPFFSSRRQAAAPVSGLCRVDDNYLVVSGDTHVGLLDLRNLKRVGEFMTGHTKPVVSLAVGGGGTVFSGAMDGMVICHDLDTQQPKYGMGANKGEASFLAVTEDRLIVSGGDGHALVYDF